MSVSTLRKTTNLISVLSILPHVFCCGIPAAMAIISLGTTVGLAGVLATNPFYQFVDAYHHILITLAIGSVLASGLFNLIAWRLDCRTAAQSSCTHASCQPQKRTSWKLFALSAVLLCLDLAWFASEELILGLHHHH